jgi:hypothetical protein
MEKITEIEIKRYPGFIIEIYKGFDKDIIDSFPANTPGEKAKLFFLFINYDQKVEWYKPISNMIGFVVDKFDGLTEEYVINFINGIINTDFSILSESL